MRRRWRFVEIDGIGINMALVTQVLVADEGDMVTLWMVVGRYWWWERRR